ncbi:hypothetical protein BN14_05681 [Rhizoctonia solani AG-1 IB]|uniref:NACHT domain-containing protein n=1 Tax=Thanatephorus cucumeris (strain AG1-IB / isolate 7/3/14) TaxID=1108050 RepID=M5BWK4_THACB|nr:hypothetical protein BN14_05681 [Rhizoctonia solani AG-1 IB]
MAACYDSAEASVVQRRECAPQTRKQVLMDLKAWKDSKDAEKVCWINGMAGTGKTTIATTFCSILRESHELGASFFCTRSLPDCRNVKLIFPTIAYQLARFSLPFRIALLQVLEQDPDVHTKLPRVQLQRMILQPLHSVADSLPANIVVVIDALDECEDGSEVGQVLHILLERASDLPVRFLVTSRPEYHIRQKIRESGLHSQVVLHELDEKVVEADIEVYLRTELKQLSISVTEQQIAELTKRAGALFIYAATAVRYIKGGNSMDRLDAVLKTSSGEQETSIKTKEIDQLYEAVLASAMNEDLEQLEKDQIQLVLHTVICAQEPLTVVALAGLLGLTSARVEAALKPLWSVVRVSESSPEDRVSTMHASFPDYMLNPSRSGRFTCNVKAHNARLVEFCFSRIRKNTDQFNICNLSSSHVFDKDVPGIEERVKQKIPLDLLYACEYWAVHLCSSGSPSEGLHQLHDFLSKRLLLWIEVLNLKNRIHKAAVLIDGTLSWLQAIPDSEGTTRLARDARRFVTLFATSPVSASTPHIYVSMLTSWPSRQSVSEHYAHRVERPISITGLQAADRQQSLLSLIPARSQIYCVAYSSNGAFFAAGTFDGRVLVWDAMTLQLTIDPVCAHNQTVNGIAISPDDTQVCSCSADMTICIWDIHTGAQIAGPLTGHTHQVWSVDYSRDGKWLASGSLDGTVRIWSTDTWLMQSGPLGNENKRVVSVVFSPDSTVLAAGSDSQICLWDPLSGQKIREPLSHHTGLVTTLTFLHDGAYLVSGSYDHTICVWDVSTGQLAHGPFREHSSSVTAVIASPTGHLLVSASMGSTMRIWDTATWQTYALFRSTGLVRSVKFSPDGQRLLSGSADANIRIWEVPQAPADSTTCKQSEAHDDWVRSVAFSPCGTFIVSGSSDMTVRMWDTQKQPPTCTTLTAHRDRVLAVGISADSSHIFSLSQDRIVCVWERQTGQLEYTAGPIETDGDYDPMYQDFWPAVFVFDDRRVVCGSRSGRIYMWQDGNQTHELTGHTAPVYSIALSADSQRFVSGDGIGDLIVWDARTGQQLHGPFSTHSRDVNDVAFSPDGSHIASASGDTTVHLWKPDNATQSSTSLRGHSDIVLCVAYSHRGDRVISGSSDRTIRMWDVASGTSIAVLTGHIGDVLSVAFSGDGRQFASGSADGTIRVWNAPACEGDSQSKPNDSMARQPRVTGDHGGCDWTIDSDGWVHDQDSRLVLWVPPDLRSGLVMPQNTMVMSSQGSIELDFMDARIGDMWQSCYRPL